MSREKKSTLYWAGIVKGKQLFDVGDNIKDVFPDIARDLMEDKKPLTWGSDFSEELRELVHDLDFRDGGKIPDAFHPGKFYHCPEETSINKSVIIFNGRGTIKGMIQISRNNKEELREFLQHRRENNGE